MGDKYNQHINATVRREEPALEKKNRSLVKKMLARPENQFCAECGGKGPTWASINLGVFVCLPCSGVHRNLGVHISKVKSCSIDTWNREWIDHVQQLGNGRGNAIWEGHMPEGHKSTIRFPDFSRGDVCTQSEGAELERFIRDK
jgi:stromal membrane-associated protein